ncbi:hypothetical protein [Lentzea sp.]|uniref:hypothetical protein n=1 Tax=Lentzea sp. TaxID=56099 RepID=UPI002BD7DA9C|nr:hypothetical protein [Lentzea sp.]HUQ57331.1 hypothetical protein [Lentzea sp.]
MIFSAPLGPGHIARQQLCRAGEHLVWAMYRQTFYYAVDGLDQLGAPGRSLFTRGVSAMGRGVGDLALTVLGGGGDTGDDKAPAADHLVFGPSPRSSAASALSRFEPGKRVERLWALTSERLVVAERAAAAPAETSKSFLGKAIGFGREVGKILADTRKKYGEHVEGEPVTAPAFEVVLEFPRAQIAAAEPGRVTFTDGSGVEFLLDSPAPADDDVVVRELTEFWLRPGEHLVLGLPPIVGYVGGVVGGTLHVPWTPAGPMPALELDKLRWPLPAPPSPPDWIDDPTLGYWVEAPAASCAAVQLADHFAFSRGNARLAVSDQRVAVVYPTHLFEAKPSSVFTTFAEIPRGAVRSMENAYAGQSLPARPVVRLTFADGSSLALRRP